MPLVNPPTVIPLGSSTKDRHYSVSFEYNFDLDPIVQCNLGGVSFLGSVYMFNILSARSPAAFNLPDFKTLQFSQTFEFGTDSEDGALIVYVPSSGQLVQLGTTGYQGAGDNTVTSLCGVIPIVSNAPTQIMFGKAVNPLAETLGGRLIATLFDFSLPPYTVLSVVEQY
jgi:hypothetical protein